MSRVAKRNGHGRFVADEDLAGMSKNRIEWEKQNKTKTEGDSFKVYMLIRIYAAISFGSLG